MRKAFFTLSFLLALNLFSQAQLKQISAGPEFQEPETGFAKIIQMKNGNTIYIHITVLNGIFVRIYDSNHKEKVVENSIPSYGELKWKGHTYGMRTESILGTFEVNNDVLIFMATDVTPHKQTVYKLLIDGTTGKLKADEIVATLGDGWVLVTKDQVNDHYAISICNQKDMNSSTVNTIILYNNVHKEIRRISPEESPAFGQTYKKVSLNRVTMINDKIYAFFRGYSSLRSPGNKPLPGNTHIAISESGNSFSKNLVQFKLPEETDIGPYQEKYNPINKKIYFFIMKNNFWENYKRNHRYYMYVNIFDTETKKMESFDEMGLNEQTNDDHKKRFSKKDDYLGMAQNIYINDDGGFSLLCEERSAGGVEADINYLGKVLQSNYDKDGKFKSAYIIPKNHNVFNKRLWAFYQAEWETTAQELVFGLQYKSFIYLDGKENKYILFNDVDRNNNVKGDRYTTVAAVNGTDTYIYKLTGNDLVPERVLAFGEPGKENKVAMILVSDYNKETNTLVTLMLNKGSQSIKTVNLVWAQPQ